MSVRKVLAINGGRKTNNTAIMLQKALEGAKSEGAQTEIIHLHDYSFVGCLGCMACKKLKNYPPKTCFHKDALSPILEKCIYEADSVIVGSPIYFWQPNGFFRCFTERLLYPFLDYEDPEGKNLYPRKDQKWSLIFTMGAPKSMIDELTCNKNGDDSMNSISYFYKSIIGDYNSLKVYITKHVKNVDTYRLKSTVTPERKLYQEQNWDEYLRKAYLMGKKLAKP